MNKYLRPKMKLVIVLAYMMCCGTGRATAQSGGARSDRVVVLRNLNSPASVAVADDYILRRGMIHILDVQTQDAALSANAETVPFADYLKDIEAPLRGFLRTHQEIDFIVLTKGIPIRISGAVEGPWGRCSLDSHLAALGYDSIPGANRVMVSDINYGADYHGAAWANRFWNSRRPFSHAVFGGYLVTRLDGYTTTDAIALTTNALEAERRSNAGIADTGSILLDICPAYGVTDKSKQPFSIRTLQTQPGDTIAITHESTYGDYNTDMELAADTLAMLHTRFELESTESFAGNRTELDGYISWGSNDVKYDASLYHSLRFAPGALCETAVSTSARTFLPTAGGQSLVADLIAQGVTGMKGYTDEPLLQAVASPSILFDRYQKGWSLAESYYAASNLVGWQDVIIGDPLCTAHPAVSTGISSVLPCETLFAVYPNPCADIMHVPDAPQASFIICTTDGKWVKGGTVENRQLDIHDLKDGVYYVVFFTDKQMVCKTVLKMKSAQR